MESCRRLFFPLIVLGALAPALVRAECCAPCYPCGGESWWCDYIEVTIDFLWWKPCIDDLDYAAVVCESESKKDVQYHGICPKWEPGIRAILGLPCFYLDWGLRASYTYIELDDSSSIAASRKITSPLLHQSITSSEKSGLCDKAEASWDMSYNEWDILFTYNCACHPCHKFTPFFGVAGIYIQQDLDVTLTDYSTEHEIEWESEYWGVGLRAGAEYRFTLCPCFQFFTTVHGTLLAGDADSDYEQEFSTELEFDDDSCCLFVPGYHIGVGFIYDARICDVDFTLRLGYEFHEWKHIPNQRVFSGDNGESEVSHATSSNTRILGFHGLIAGITVDF